MSNLSIFKTNWNDLVFEGRNKSYGAYQLRNENDRTTMKAFLLGTCLIAAFISIPVISNYMKEAIVIPTNRTIYDVLVVTDFQKIYNPPAPTEPVAAPKAVAPKAIQTQTSYVAPVVTNTTETVKELPTVAVLETTKAGSTDVIGSENGSVVLGRAGEGNGPEVLGATTGTGDTEGTIYNTAAVEKMPTYPGGIKQFLSEVGRKFKVPSSAEEKVTTARVYVNFVVERDGSISNIQVIKDPGYGLGQEAIRVLRSIKTKWTPGMQNGKAVRTAYNLPITVNVQ